LVERLDENIAMIPGSQEKDASKRSATSDLKRKAQEEDQIIKRNYIEKH